MRGRWGVRLFGIALFIVIVMAGFGQAVLQLWNWLMPSVFGLHPITYWQAVGLLGLSWIFFGGWRGRPLPGWHLRRGGWGPMTPEERERFRERMRGRCGRPDSTSAEPKPAGVA